eukprot:TRINITY_DN92484_c0_g1_i1.p1 TRINITY_DN92484_c0_g1~~TRINITY_DN92484_c0_g1_i1.p1  ORF type:complete len:609 (-),score=127.17 TRINITY_DN92484_c0_g1_i1:125-1951(-)
MALSMAIQQTLHDVQKHYEVLQEQVSGLQGENRELKKRLSDMGPSSPQVMEALVSENSKLKAKLASRQVQIVDLPGSLESTGSITAELEPLEAPSLLNGHGSPKYDMRKGLDAHGIKKVDTDMVNEQMAKERARRRGFDNEDTLVSNKFQYLKTTPFPDEEEDEALWPEKKFGIKQTCQSLCGIEEGQSQGDCFKKFISGICFKSLTMLAIAANTMYLGFAADQNVKNSYKRFSAEPRDPASMVPDIAFAGWFTLELILKAVAEKKLFLTGEDKYWNFFDMALVAESIFGIAMDGESMGLSFLRIFRVFRLVRVVRVVRTVKALARLRTMIFAILNSFVDLLWAFLVIMLIMFVFAIIFDNAVATYFDEVDLNDPVQVEAAEAVHAMYGTLHETIVSLWSAVSGGNDWMQYGEVLRRIGFGDAYFYTFNFYVAFCVVGLFNVVTGVFVDSAVCIRTGDEVVQGYLDDLKNTTAEIKSFFKEADKDNSGTLSWREFEQHMRTPAVKAYFAGLDIDPEEAGIIFTILDGDKSKEILIDEFVNGTMKLKGSATKLDLMAMMYDTTKQNLKIDHLCDFVEAELMDIKRRLPQARTAPGGKEMPRAVAVARRL